MSIDNRYKIPADASANVHSVSAIGEQYLDLVSTGNPGQYLSPGSTITDSTVPSEVGPALDAANNGLAVLPKEKIDLLLTETSQRRRRFGAGAATVGRLDDQPGAGLQGQPACRSTTSSPTAAPILDSQVQSGDNIEQWSRNLDVIAAQTAEQDAALRSGLQQAAPTLDQVNTVFSGVRDSLPQTLANLAIVIDMLKRYNKGLEQTLVILPQGAAASQAGTLFEDLGQLPLALSINQPPPCLTGFLPASEWRSPADTSMAPLPKGTYCKIPKDYQGNVVRGARNYPCVDVPGKRAATPMECRSPEPYVPLGTNPWYGDPNQILSCPAPGARCDQGVNPGVRHSGPDGQQRGQPGAGGPAASAAVHGADQ